jgi:hypothetical protein
MQRSCADATPALLTASWADVALRWIGEQLRRALQQTNKQTNLERRAATWRSGPRRDAPSAHRRNGLAPRMRFGDGRAGLRRSGGAEVSASFARGRGVERLCALLQARPRAAFPRRAARDTGSARAPSRIMATQVGKSWHHTAACELLGEFAARSAKNQAPPRSPSPVPLPATHTRTRAHALASALFAPTARALFLSSPSPTPLRHAWLHCCSATTRCTAAPRCIATTRARRYNTCRRPHERAELSKRSLRCAARACSLAGPLGRRGGYW